MDYIEKWRVNDDSLIGTVMVDGVPVAEVGPGKRTITATDAKHAAQLKASNRFTPVDPAAPEEASAEPALTSPQTPAEPSVLADGHKE